MSVTSDSILILPEALSLVLAVSRVSGVAPIHYTKIGGGYRLTISTLLSKYGYVLITVINLITLTSLINDLILDPEHSVRVTTTTRLLVWVADAGLMLIIAFISAYGAPGRMKCIINSFSKLQKVNRDLKTHQWIGSGEKKKSVLFIVWSVVTVILCLFDHGLLLINVSNDSRETMIAIMYFCYYYCYWVMNLVQMQFIMIALLVKSSFRSVNEQLMNIIQARTGHDAPILPSKYSCYKTLSANRKRKKSVNCVIDSLAMINNLKIDTGHTSIVHVIDNYVAVCDVMRNLNHKYGSMLMLLLISYFLHLIVTPYYLVHNLSDKKTDGNIWNRVIQFVWCCYHALTLIMMIEPSHQTTLEMEKTKSLVSDLMRCCDMNDMISMELELFCRHLFLNQVSYSPMQVTTLTRSLVATVFGSITTYLVVIMQF